MLSFNAYLCIKVKPYPILSREVLALEDLVTESLVPMDRITTFSTVWDAWGWFLDETATFSTGSSPARPETPQG